MSSAAAATLGPSALAATGTGSAPKYLITVVAEGGWDVTFCFDPKYSEGSIDGPEAGMVDPTYMNAEGPETFGGITIASNELMRPSASAFFEKWHDRTCVVNGVWMGSIAHDPCRFRILTGTPFGTKPDVATITGYQRGGELPLGSVDLSGWSLTGKLAASAGRIGTNSQIKPLIDPSTHFNASDNLGFNYPLYSRTDEDRVAVAEYIRKRTESLRQGRGLDNGHNDQRLDDLLASVDRASRFSEQSVGIIDDLTLGSKASMSTQASMAAALLAEGLCRTVTLDSRKDWDSHDNNDQQHGFFEGLFVGLEDLMVALEDRGILDETLVCVVSEMTRTPALNGANGKDHWGHTSALLIGAGVRGSTQLGATDDKLESVHVDFESGEPDPAGQFNKYENLLAGLLERLDVDPEEWLPGVEPYRGAFV